jgi:hypothetical protein
MPDQLQLRGGTTVQHSTFTGASKEVTVDTTKKTAVVHDGSTVGGNPLMREDASNSALALGSAAAPSLKFTGDLDSGVFSPGANQVAVATNGVGRLFVDASGNVGVGSSSVATYTGQTYLSVDHTTGGVGIAGINLATNGTRNAFLITYPGNSEALRIASDSATLPITVYTNNSERLRVTSAGLVGVGTSSPSYKLDVSVATNDPATGSPAAGSFVQVAGGTTTVGNGPSVSLSNASGAKETFWRMSAVTTSGNNGDLVFNGYNGGANYPERLRITAAGNVGIGTTTVNNGVLHVKSNGTGSQAGLAVEASANDSFLSITNNGSAHKLEASYNSTGSYQPISFVINGEKARIDTSGRLLVGTSTARTDFFNSASSYVPRFQLEGSDGSGTAMLSVLNNDSGGNPPYIILGLQKSGSSGGDTAVASGNEVGEISFQGNDGSEMVVAASIKCAIDGTPGANDMPGRLVFSTTADGASSPTERMRITNSGQVLISCTSFPSATVKGVGWANNSGVGFFYASAVSLTSSVEHAEFINPNGVVGSISTNASATAYNTSSDYRLKENIEPVTDGITRLQKLKPSRFNFIADPDTTFDGFIAHEAQAVVPECVTGEKDAVDDDGNPKHQGIDQSKLVPLLTAALQEAIGEIESLKARLTAAGI